MTDHKARITAVGTNVSRDKLLGMYAEAVDQLARIRLRVERTLADPHLTCDEEALAADVLKILDETTRDR